jgi:hypothetical protein
MLNPVDRIAKLIETVIDRVSGPPLQGRAGVFQAAKTFQLFASIADENAVLVQPDESNLMAGVGWNAPYLPQTPGPCGDGLEPRRHKCERLWRISTATQVVYRISQVALPPLTINQINAFELPGATLPAGVGAIMGGNGWFRLRVNVSDSTGNRRFFMDLDEKIELYGFDVDTAIVGPANAILINPEMSPIPTLAGNLIDARVGASIIPIEAPTGIDSTRYTQIFVVAAGATQVIAVPRFARAVKVYQTTAGAASGPWTRVAGAIGSGINVGTLNFTLRASNDAQAEIGRESHFVTDVAILSPRTFIVQWTIRP